MILFTYYSFAEENTFVEVTPVKVMTLEEAEKSPCEKLHSIEHKGTCNRYFLDTTHNSLLDDNLVTVCFLKFHKEPKLFDVCMKNASQKPGMTMAKVIFCSEVSFWEKVKSYCLEVAPVLSLREIEKCKHSNYGWGGEACLKALIPTKNKVSKF